MTGRFHRLASVGEAMAVLATLAAMTVAIVVGSQASGPRAVAAAVLAALALAAGAAPLVADAVMRSAAGPVPPVGRRRMGTVTTVIRLGGEPLEVARTSIMLAVRQGPAVLVSGPQGVPEPLRSLGAPVFSAASIEQAITAAVGGVHTDAVLFTSARAVPNARACREAAGRLGGDVAWVSGHTEPFSRDRYAPDRRELVSGRLRSRAIAAGIQLWEPDATIITTDVLREYAMQHGRPLGDYLRLLAARGLRGVPHDGAFSLRAAPVDASAYWPDALARQRANVADLRGASVAGSPRMRAIAAALMVWELYAFTLLAWVGAAALGTWSGPATALVPALGVGTAVARWAAFRGALDVTPHPGADVVSALHHAPGSLTSVGSAITGSYHAPRFSMPARPLVWAALVTTLVAGRGLVGGPGGEAPSVTTVALSLLALGLLWVFALRALLQRTWVRSTYRLRMDLAATINGSPGTVIDGSPSGIAIRLGGRDVPVEVGDPIDLVAFLGDGSVLRSRARVVGRRSGSTAPILGLVLELNGRGREQWVGELFRSATAGTAQDGPRRREPDPLESSGRLIRLTDKLGLALASVVTVGVLAFLTAGMLGFVPLVVRSSSMEPALGVGDVILARSVSASSLRVGDIVTMRDPDGRLESVSHRVRSIDVEAGRVRLETRGDANDSSEVWTVRADELIGRSDWRIPWVGAPLTALRHVPPAAFVGVAVLVVLGGLVIWIASRRPVRRREELGEASAPPDSRVGEPGDHGGRTVVDAQLLP